MPFREKELPAEFTGLLNARLRKDYTPYVNELLVKTHLMEFCLSEIKAKGKVAFSCSRIMHLASDKNIYLFNKYLDRCAEILCNNPPETSVKRTLLRIFIRAEIPEKYLANIYNIMLEIIRNQNESIACRAFSIQVLSKICKIEPGLIQEALLVIQKELLFGSAGFKNAAEHFIRQFSRHQYLNASKHL
jgi:hypothetical protein